MQSVMSVSIPKNSKVQVGRDGKSIELQLGTRAEPVRALFCADNPGRYRGTTQNCVVTITEFHEGGAVDPGVLLRPTNRKTSTHSGLRRSGDNIVFDAR